MGHNRGWEEAASDFTGQQLELKTANAALLETTGDSWEDVRILSSLLCSSVFALAGSSQAFART
jgi:hypothetical protein